MRTSICIATGASLTQEDVDFVRGKGKVYVVNDAYKLAPWADVLYACDWEWWKYHQPEFAGEKWTANEAAAGKFGLNHIKLSRDTWSNKQGEIGGGGNSGYQCLNLAILQGAERVILLGYDMHAKEKRHYFGDHPQALLRGSNYNEWVRKFTAAAPMMQAEVINCTKGSALECFPKMPLRYAFT